MGNTWLILLILVQAVLFVYCVWLVHSSNKANREYNEKMDQHMQDVFPLMRKKKEGGEP